MPEITVRVNSSSGGQPHQVIFKLEHGKLHVRCTCQAGERGVLCRHRLDVVDGRANALAEPIVAGDWVTVQEWISDSGFRPLVFGLRSAEEAAVQAEREVKRLKHQLQRLMADGIAVSD
jgi:hypothetical protein